MSRQNEHQGFFAHHAVGDVIDGTVVSVVPFGAFVEVADGLHGLLPKPEWTDRPEPGAPVRVRILAVDPDRSRLSLSPA